MIHFIKLPLSLDELKLPIALQMKKYDPLRREPALRKSLGIRNLKLNENQALPGLIMLWSCYDHHKMDHGIESAEGAHRTGSKIFQNHKPFLIRLVLFVWREKEREGVWLCLPFFFCC